MTEALVEAIGGPETRANYLDKTALVGVDFTTGSELVRALDRAALSISVALRLYSQEHEDWRFVLASRRLDAAEPSNAYGMVNDALAAAGISLEQTPPLAILRMSDPFIRALRRLFAKAKSVEGMRLGGQLIGDRFVEDALVFRIR
jgi:hypothetical protein